MSEELVLVQWESNYADEFDITSQYVIEKAKWENYLTKLHINQDSIFPIEAGFGTNEEVYVDTFDEFKGQLVVTGISSKEHEILKRLNVINVDPYCNLPELESEDDDN